MLKEVPDWDIKKIKNGYERSALADLVIQLSAAFRDDWFGDMNVWEALQMSAIMLNMYQIHEVGNAASQNAISRGMGMPRATVTRKLATLKKRGFVEQLGTKYVLSIEGFNEPRLLAGFAKRLGIARSSLGKILASLPTEQSRAVHALDTRTARPR